MGDQLVLWFQTNYEFMSAGLFRTNYARQLRLMLRFICKEDVNYLKKKKQNNGDELCDYQIL